MDFRCGFYILIASLFFFLLIRFQKNSYLTNLFAAPVLIVIVLLLQSRIFINTKCNQRNISSVHVSFRQGKDLYARIVNIVNLKSSLMSSDVSISVNALLSPFQANVPILYPLKTPENLWFD